MDNNLIAKYRTLGIIFLIVLLAFAILFSFISIREKKDVAFKLKMFFSEITQTLQFSTSTNGQPSEWNLSSDGNLDSLKLYIIDGLRVSKDCLNAKGNCFVKTEYKNLANKYSGFYPNKHPSVVLQNGIAIAFEAKGSCKNINEVCYIFYVDVNSIEPPNVIGKDLFAFEFINSHTSSFRPYGLSDYSSVISDKTYGCSKKAEVPLYCSSLLFSKNWRVEKDYPW